MSTLLLLAVIVVVIALITKRKTSPQIAHKFTARRLLSTPEQVLYGRLRLALPDYYVFSQINLSAFLVASGTERQKAHNTIHQLRADFVICDKSAAVLAVVELDDSSHDGEKQKKRDAKKDAALASAGIKVTRWTVKNIPDTNAIRAALIAAPLSTPHAENSAAPAKSPASSDALGNSLPK